MCSARTVSDTPYSAASPCRIGYAKVTAVVAVAVEVIAQHARCCQLKALQHYSALRICKSCINSHSTPQN
eukprot:16776-Heterococcus_DN1.PRE.2